MILVSSIKENFCLSITPSLARVRFPIALAVTRPDLPWHNCTNFFRNRFRDSILKDKDCIGFSLLKLAPASDSDIITELTKKFKENNKFGANLESYLAKNIKEYQKYPVKEGNYRSLRRLSSYQGSQALVIEFDQVEFHKAMPEYMIDYFNRIGTSYVAYSTWSATPENRKYRIIVPYSHVVDRKDHNFICEIMTFLIDQRYNIVSRRNLDLSCFRPIQFFYPPNNKVARVTDDNTIKIDKPWFVYKDNGFGLDVDRLYAVSRYIYKNKVHLKTLQELNRLAKTEVKDGDNKPGV
jgi:hypothetical protein